MIHSDTFTRMNRTDRLLAIVLELQRHRIQRAEDLAATFETSKRTIYRDLEALAESGVPLISTPGQGYALVDGFFLPPVSFSNDEATLLLLGANVMAQNFDAQYQRAAQNAAAKIEAVLGNDKREAVSAIQLGLSFVTPTAASEADGAVMERLQLLRHALLKSQAVRFEYVARFGSKAGQEPASKQHEVDPHGLSLVEGNWYLSGLDHAHEETRRFRLDRMQALTLLEQTFMRPEPQDLLAERAKNRPNDLQLGVKALFDTEVARWVRETRSWFAVAYEDAPDGLLITFKVRHEEELVQFLLQWGRHVRVLEPQSLRQKLAREAEAMLQNYQS